MGDLLLVTILFLKWVLLWDFQPLQFKENKKINKFPNKM